jgi:hypothetical protein
MMRQRRRVTRFLSGTGKWERKCEQITMAITRAKALVDCDRRQRRAGIHYSIRKAVLNASSPSSIIFSQPLQARLSSAPPPCPPPQNSETPKHSTNWTTTDLIPIRIHQKSVKITLSSCNHGVSRASYVSKNDQEASVLYRSCWP